jgi:agmatinase
LLEEDDLVRRMGLEARGAAREVIDAGGVIGKDRYLAEALGRANQLGGDLNEWLRAEVERWLDRGKFVGVVGGDHSVSFGIIQALARRHPKLGILHFDAHADLRAAYEGFTWSHASIMYNVATHIPEVERIVQVGIRDVGQGEVDFIEASDGRIISHFEPDAAAMRFTGESWGDQCARIVAGLPREVHVSFDIDGLDPVYCPHTGTPVPGGLSFAQATFLLRVLGESGKKIVGFDLTEVAPGNPARESPDPKDEWDGNVGARILYKMIGWALRTR